MGWVSVKFVSRLLTDEQKQWCVFVYQELLVRNVQNLVITVDETRLYCYDPETKQQSCQGITSRISLKFSNSCR
jgi:hypothetical protein